MADWWTDPTMLSFRLQQCLQRYQDYRLSGNLSEGAYGRGGRGNFRDRFRHFNPDSARFRNRPGGAREDDDGDAANGNQRDRHGYRGRSSGNRRSNRRHSDPSSGNYRRTDSWYKVMVPFGSSISQEDLYGLIKSAIHGPFEPVSYSTDDKRAYFYVKGSPIAGSLRSISRRIIKPDGHKLVLSVSLSEAPPGHEIDETTVEKQSIDEVSPVTVQQSPASSEEPQLP